MEYRAGKEIQHVVTAATKVVNDAERLVDFVASNEGLDRYNTRVKGWVLEHFVRNPVILWAHNHSLPPIGRAREVTITDEGELKIRVQFAPAKAYELAGTVYNLVKEGYINGMSVGFIPGDVERQEDGTYDLLDNDLLEASIVPVPANPEALKLAFSRGMVPVEHTTLMSRNSAATVESIEGCDMEQANREIKHWMESQEEEVDAMPSIMLADEPQVPEVTDEVLEVEELHETAVTELTMEACLEKLAERQGLYDASVAELAAARGELAAIAEIVECEEGADLIPVIQEYVERAGAVLSRKNQSRLEAARQAIDEVIDDASKSPAEETTESATTEEETPVEKSSPESDDRIIAVVKRLEGLEHALSAKSVMQTRPQPAEQSEGRVERLIKRLQIGALPHEES